jgi:hypothetical protein
MRLQLSRRRFAPRIAHGRKLLQSKKPKSNVCPTHSEAEPRLQIDHSPGQAGLRQSKFRIAGYTVGADDVAWKRIVTAVIVEIGQIQFVKDVEEISAELEPCILSQNRELRKTE